MSVAATEDGDEGCSDGGTSSCRSRLAVLSTSAEGVQSRD